MISFDDFVKYLPYNVADPESLFDELKQKVMDNRLYTYRLNAEPNLFQGDIINDLPICILPKNKITNCLTLLISNTCDVSLDNKREMLDPVVNYVPVLDLESLKKYCQNKGVDKNKVDNFIISVKKQYISNMFYLPACGDLAVDSVALLDRVVSHENSKEFHNNSVKKRVFVLSQYGHYLFCLKIAIHLTRLTENVDRRPIDFNNTAMIIQTN